MPDTVRQFALLLSPNCVITADVTTCNGAKDIPGHTVLTATHGQLLTLSAEQTVQTEVAAGKEKAAAFFGLLITH
jgi:hypothetical protein